MAEEWTMSASGTGELSVEAQRQKTFAYLIDSVGIYAQAALCQPGTKPGLVADVRLAAETAYWKQHGHDPQYIFALDEWAKHLGAQVAVLKGSGLEGVVLEAGGIPNPFEEVRVITSFGQPTSCLLDAVSEMIAKGIRPPIIGAGSSNVKFAKEPLEALGYSVRTFPNLVLQVIPMMLDVVGKSAGLYSTLLVATLQQEVARASSAFQHS